MKKKVKLWSVTVNHPTWNKPQTYYFTSRIVAARASMDFEYSTNVVYCGMFSTDTAYSAIDFETYDMYFTTAPKILYYRSYDEFMNRGGNRMTYTQVSMIFALMREMLNTYNKYSANNQKGKMKYLQGMIHGVYTSIEMCGGSVKITQKDADKDGNPTRFADCTIIYKCHHFHASMKTYYNTYKKRR